MTVLLVHGVPDTAHMWAPLVKALDLPEGEIVTPSLPGFEKPAPDRFPSTKEAYVDWLILRTEELVKQSGEPLHVLGHDWGAILTARLVSVRPDLFKTWAVSNAYIDSKYRGHRMAVLWATPLVGELVMLLARNADMAQGLKDIGMPDEVAEIEGKYWSPFMRSNILKLYRSARGLNGLGEWEPDLKKLPERGMVIHGENDPYVGLDVAERFRDRWGFPLHVLEGVGHWGMIQKPEETAALLKAHWGMGGI